MSGRGALVVVDANVLIAAADPANALHSAAKRLLAGVPMADRRIHPVNLAEVLVGPALAGLADQAQADWAAVGVVPLSGDVVGPADVANVRARHRAPLPDAYALASALRLNARLATFDSALAAAARRAGVAVLAEPSASP